MKVVGEVLCLVVLVGVRSEFNLLVASTGGEWRLGQEAFSPSNKGNISRLSVRLSKI